MTKKLKIICYGLVPICIIFGFLLYQYRDNTNIIRYVEDASRIKSKTKSLDWFENNKQGLEFIAKNIYENIEPGESFYAIKLRNKELQNIYYFEPDREEILKKKLKDSIIRINGFDTLEIVCRSDTNPNYKGNDVVFFNENVPNIDAHYSFGYYPNGINSDYRGKYGVLLTEATYPVVEIFDDNWQMIELTNRYKP